MIHFPVEASPKPSCRDHGNQQPPIPVKMMNMSPCKFLLLPLLVGMSGGANADMFKPSKGQQIKLGEQAAHELTLKERVLSESDERVQLLRRVGHRLIDQMSAKDKDWPTPLT